MGNTCSPGQMKSDPFEVVNGGGGGGSNRSADQIEQTPPAAAAASSRPTNKRQRSLFRVGSQVLTRSKKRMSTYGHVQDAVRYNLQEANAVEEERLLPVLVDYRI